MKRLQRDLEAGDQKSIPNFPKPDHRNPGPEKTTTNKPKKNTKLSGDDCPNSKQYKSIYHSLAIESLFKISKNSNCGEDIDVFALEASALSDLIVKSVSSDIAVAEHDYSASFSSVPMDNELLSVYTSGNDFSLGTSLSSDFNMFMDSIDLTDCNVAAHIA